jgi:hypothetical protein
MWVRKALWGFFFLWIGFALTISDDRTWAKGGNGRNADQGASSYAPGHTKQGRSARGVAPGRVKSGKSARDVAPGHLKGKTSKGKSRKPK